MAVSDLDSRDFAAAFQWPLVVTALLVLHYVTVDTWAVGAARTPYQLKYPFTGEGHDAEKLVPFLRALRAQQNTVEQAWAFLAAMWACAAAFNSDFAGGCGVVWLLARSAYGYLYRVNPSRNKLMLATVPAYLSQLSACAGILAAVLPLNRGPALATAFAFCFAFAAYGWFVYRPWFGRRVAEEKAQLEEGLLESSCP
mmetsp:Transcript_144704/g.360714  ORF Transcript_144704/g.360714 Transcript_144704/m.360714 type:complete len:198 (+) Transcript_144704:64-657(+)|eukprot:CAMPEP_0115234638 /NCGR_PEP_ID=MMETSP0270-20121206/34896_1 /TAXON_ID=71861 /ORGANISM="Scrippsiella trochoidea, Strain CCMP3099" /LENGTH=197 /DNA_ID=CAMNT_0002649391 /DNA_START=64 /DNA_END=657 /DNA_ORIENTATION=-